MTIKSISSAGWLKDINDNFGLFGTAGSDIGLGVLHVARFEYDGAANASAGVSNLTVAAHGVGVTLPIHAIVVGGFVDVNTAFASVNSTATIAIKVEGANDIISAA